MSRGGRREGAGRPPRPVLLRVKLTEAEAAELRRRAKLYGHTLSGFARLCLGLADSGAISAPGSWSELVIGGSGDVLVLEPEPEPFDVSRPHTWPAKR